jgi:hypothetical protein
MVTGGAHLPMVGIKTLAQRAEFTDEKSTMPIMVNMLLTVFAMGHLSVHGTYTALYPFFEAFKTGTVPVTEKRLAELAQSLIGINFALYLFGGFVIGFFRLDNLEGEFVANDKLEATR